MHIDNIAAIACLVVAVVFLTFLVVCGVIQKNECEKKGGQLVRSQTGYICAEIKEIK
jgi:hypothetical protein